MFSYMRTQFQVDFYLELIIAKVSHCTTFVILYLILRLIDEHLYWTFMCTVCIKFSIIIGLVRTALVNIPLDLNYLQFNEDLGDSGDRISVSSNADYHGFWIRYYCAYQILCKISKNVVRFYFPHVIFQILGIIRLDFWKAPLQLEGKHYHSIFSSSSNNRYYV